MLVGVGLKEKRTYACWFDELPLPSKIYVPRRWDFEEQWERMKKEWPGIPLEDAEYEKYKSGSGTPYMLVPKSLSIFTSLTNFITTELLYLPMATQWPELKRV